MSAPMPWHERALIRQLAVRGFPQWLLAQRFGRNRSTISVVTRGVARRRKPPGWRREYARERRELLSGHGLCLNGGAHGPATHGRLCGRCRETHRRSA